MSDLQLWTPGTWLAGQVLVHCLGTGGDQGNSMTSPCWQGCMQYERWGECGNKTG